MKGHLALWLFAVSAGQAGTSHEEMIKTVVTGLGVRQEEGLRETVERLAADAPIAARYLVEELQVVDTSVVRPSDWDRQRDAMHVIWCLRALRYITNCKQFLAPTTYQFSESERTQEEFLTKHGRERLPFFATWMSRDKTYLAPRDVQEAIILSWQRWYSEEGTTFNYQACGDVDDWYF